ncbi:hypothetical protein ymoll0001_3090 [Yersinia mollaretii ATCC 43969]|uniref:Integrase n=1 Tax=Yersinia mollaretii (strain ATCC 43969 / DSM 18520 / CIP 103324 / CNY 7263 / WAIP 204) TaxID=349967 RepID=A0ABP2EE22_YERMW|nr:hypothetical protein ymoll0001_3090 [Yersinia mollaretii ATCC 43969]
MACGLNVNITRKRKDFISAYLLDLKSKILSYESANDIETGFT